MESHIYRTGGRVIHTYAYMTCTTCTCACTCACACACTCACATCIRAGQGGRAAARRVPRTGQAVVAAQDARPRARAAVGHAMVHSIAFLTLTLAPAPAPALALALTLALTVTLTLTLLLILTLILTLTRHVHALKGRCVHGRMAQGPAGGRVPHVDTY